MKKTKLCQNILDCISYLKRLNKDNPEMEKYIEDIRQHTYELLLIHKQEKQENKEL